jgi:hypothetical protein
MNARVRVGENFFELLRASLSRPVLTYMVSDKVSLPIAHCDRLRYASQRSLDIVEIQVAGHLGAEPTYTVGIQPSLIRLCSTSR